MSSCLLGCYYCHLLIAIWNIHGPLFLFYLVVYKVYYCFSISLNTFSNESIYMYDQPVFDQFFRF